MATDLDSGSDDEISKVNYDTQEDLPQDDPETLDIDEQIEIYFQHNKYKVNSELAELVIEALEEMGVLAPRTLAATWSPYRFQGMANYIEACDRENLPLKYGEEQINAFLNYIHEKHYAVTTLSSHFCTIQLIGKELDMKPSTRNLIKYKFVRDHGKKMKDNKLPVSRQLLLQLCRGADNMLVGYTAVLAKTMFLCAWAFSMRISEFSRTKAKTEVFKHSHNVTSKAILTSTVGLSACFDSDKTSKFDPTVRHRTVRWHKLPDFTKEVVDMYISLRPDTDHFFCMKDGQELDRNNVLNLLDVCLLMTDWAHLRITPHAFRQGMCSEDTLAELDPNRIRFAARWSNRSDSSEPYMRSDLVGISAIDIWKRDEKYHRKWTAKRLSFLARNIVQTQAKCEQHPMHRIISKEFPQQFKKIQKELPTKYPSIESIKRSKMEEEAVRKGTYIKLQTSERVRAEHELLRRTAIAVAARKASLAKRYARFRERRDKYGWSERAMMLVKEKAEARRIKQKRAENRRGDDLVDSAAQTVIVPSGPEPMMYYKKELIPVHMDAIDLIPDYCFEVKVYEERVKLQKMNLPNEDGVASRRAAANKRLLQEAIMRRISKRARKAHVYSSRRNKKSEGNKMVRTRTHNKLIGYIINEYMVKGEVTLPMVDDVTDPEESDEDYYYRVVRGIQNKHPDYETLMPPAERQTSHHRAMRIKVRTPIATPSKAQPTPDSDEEFPLMSTEKSLDQLPCTERAHDETQIDNTPKKATVRRQLNMDKGQKRKREDQMKPCSVILPKLDLRTGDEVKVTIEWPNANKQASGENDI